MNKGRELSFELIKFDLLKSIEKGTPLNKIIIFENLEQTSSNILDALIPLFDISRDKILLRTGDYIEKVTFNLIATYDPTTKGNSVLNVSKFIYYNLNE